MNNSNSATPSQDGSPFDLPKSYIYNTITDYHVNKVSQLVKSKNYDLALIEIKGLSDSCDLLGLSDKCKEFNDLYNQISSSINKRNELRNKLFNDLAKTNNENEKLKLLENFIEGSKELEEYSTLQDKIVNKNDKNADEISKILFSFDPLKYLVEVGRIEKEFGLNPFVLFDLDSTLFDNSPRVHKIIQDFVEEHKDIYPEHVEKMSLIKRQDIVWGIKENLKKVNIHDEEINNKVIRYWFERFFSNEYIIDLPLNGSQQFVKDLERVGVRIIYLTGRFESMREGTERNIVEHGFPLEPNGINLVLKPDPKMPDDTFKHQTMESMKRFGDMIAGFENEPINSNIFQEHYPDSEIFFLETNHSINPPNISDKIHTIKDFSYR